MIYNAFEREGCNAAPTLHKDCVFRGCDSRQPYEPKNRMAAMFESVKYFITPPVFADNEGKSRKASLLNIITICAFFGALIYGPFAPHSRLPYLGLALGIIFASWVAMRRGHVDAASLTVVIGISAVLAINTYSDGGIRSPAYNGFFVVILLAGFLLGWKAAAGVTALSILYGIILLQAGSRGLLSDAFVYDDHAYLIFHSLLFVMTGGVFLLALQIVNDALRRANKELAERKQAEMELFQFRMLMDESNDAIFMIDLETGHYIDFNKSAHEFLGYSRKELAQLAVMDVALHLPDLDTWQKRVELLRKSGSLIFETIYKRKDLSVFPVEVSARLLSYGGKNIMVGVVRDIAERKRAEEALIASEMKFRMLAENTPIVVYQCKNDSRFTFLYLSDAVEALTGYAKEQFIEKGLSFFDLYHPEDVGGIVVSQDELHYNKRSFHITYRIRHASGEWRWVDEWGAYVTNELDQVEYIVGMMNDITERKQAEEALRESEARFRKIFHSSPIAICITSLEEGRMLDANEAYWELTGYSRESSIGRDYIELNLWDGHPEERAEFVRDLKERHSVYNPDYEFRDTEGRKKSAIAFYELIQIGERACILSILYDMTVQKLTIQALQQSEARIRALFNAFPDMVLELSLDGRVINMVPPHGMETAMPAEQFIGKQIDEIYKEETASQTKFAMQRASESGHLSVFEFEIEMSGKLHTMEARLTGSASNTVLMMVRDISQRKWIEKEREDLITELETKNAESETLRRSLASIVSKLEFTEIIDHVLEEIKRVIPYDTASVWRVEGTEQYIISGVDLPPEIEIPGTVFSVNESNSAYPLLMGKMPYMLSNNVQEELSDFQEAPHTYVQSWLAIPMKTRGRIIGMINLDGRNRNQFTKHHAELAVTFANQLAIALDNVLLISELQGDLEERRKLIAELENKNAESETLRESVAIVAATLEKSEAVDRILEQLERVVPFDSASVQLIHGNMLNIVSARGFPLSPNPAENSFVLNESEPAYPVIQGSVPYILYDDIQPQVAAFTEPPHNRIHAWMAVPLTVKGKTIGIIALDGYKVGQFTERHAQLAVTYASQVAIALENARLFFDLQSELSMRKKLISELENKNAELERFSYTVSHDLKSPLFTIRGFLGYLEKDALSGNIARLRSDIQRITDATDKMQRLLNDLLELSRIGRLMNESQAVPFGELAREVVELVQGRIIERGIAVQVEENLPVVFGDRQRLLEVLLNLLDNATKFMGSQREPCIVIGQYGTVDGMPVLFIRDNGMGIQPEHHERIFGLFNKLDVKSDGTGIGLALVKRIIEVHGGRIWLESKVGEGATFYFTLPKAESAV